MQRKYGTTLITSKQYNIFLSVDSLLIEMLTEDALENIDVIMSVK